MAAFTLGYYYGDYRLIATTTNTAFEMAVGPTTSFNLASPGLYNGNIRHAVYTIARLKHGTAGYPEPEGYAYKYDQLNRLRSQRAYTSGYSLSSNAWVSSSASTLFQEDATYDPNGNILTYYRRGNTGTPAVVMDDLTYHYGSDNNRLLHIDDAQTNTSAYPDDLEDQSSGNYTYDATGNLFEDGTMSHEWTNAQKLAYVSVLPDYTLTFRYDATQQNRVAKYETGQGWQRRHYYVRDAQGNVMATYKLWKHSAMGVTYLDSFKLMEQHIYGSSRVGYVQPEQMLYPVAPENPHACDSCHYVIFEGWKRYEVANHLGNVLAVITDRKRGRASSGTAIQWYEADVLSAQQYYPFGMLMPGNASATLRRQYSLNSYDHRYGFNGKEGDDEVKGDDNQQDYGMRIYDPRVARFLSVDPIAREYPWYTPYQFAGNMPIAAVDLDGLEPASPPQYENQPLPGQLLAPSEARDAARVADHPGYRREIVPQGNNPRVATIDVPFDEKKRAAIAKNNAEVLKVLVADPQALKEGDPIEIASIIPAGKAGKLLKGVAKGVENAVDAAKITEEVVKVSTDAFKHSYKYADRVRLRAVQDPVSHNFPYSFDDAILSTNPVSKSNGYRIFQQQGVMNGKDGVFEIGLTKDGIIDHRFFRPNK